MELWLNNDGCKFDDGILEAELVFHHECSILWGKVPKDSECSDYMSNHWNLEKSIC